MPTGRKDPQPGVNGTSDRHADALHVAAALQHGVPRPPPHETNSRREHDDHRGSCDFTIRRLTG